MYGHLKFCVTLDTGTKFKRVTLSNQWVELPEDAEERSNFVDKVAQELRTKNPWLPEIDITFSPSPERYFR